jgi:DNA-binding NarL/FixJ family response regulator
LTIPPSQGSDARGKLRIYRPIEVFVCDEAPGFRSLARVGLEQTPELRVVGEAPNADAGLGAIAHLQPDVVLLGLSSPTTRWLEAIPRVREQAPSASIVVLGDQRSSTLGTLALARGAHRSLDRDAPWHVLRTAIRQCAIAHRNARAPWGSGALDWEEVRAQRGAELGRALGIELADGDA